MACSIGLASFVFSLMKKNASIAWPVSGVAPPIVSPIKTPTAPLALTASNARKLAALAPWLLICDPASRRLCLCGPRNENYLSREISYSLSHRRGGESDRLRAIYDVLQPQFLLPDPGTGYPADLLLVHTPRLLQSMPQQPDVYDVALLAAGGAILMCGHRPGRGTGLWTSRPLAIMLVPIVIGGSAL